MTGIPILSAQSIQGPGAPSIQPMQSSAPGQIAQAGQALQGFGLEVAQAADRMQDDLDESAARQALRDLAERQRAILRDPATGYLGTAGANAVAGRQAAMDALKAAQDDVAGTLASQQAQALFRRQADLRMQEAAWDVDGHAGRELREFDKTETSAAIDLYADEAVEWFGRSDPGGTVNKTYRLRLDAALEQFDRLASISGVPQDSITYQSLRRKVTGKIAAGNVAKLLKVDPDKAWDHLRNARTSGDLDPDANRTLTAKVQEAVTLQQGQQAASIVFEASKGSAAAAGKMLEQAKLPPDVLKAARAELKARADTQKAVRDEDSAAVLDDMRTWAIRHPWASWQDWEQQNPKHAAYASANGLLDDVVEYFASGKSGADNPAVVAFLESQGEDFWKGMPLKEFEATYKLKLAPKTFTGYVKKIQDAKPEAPKPVASAEDLNKLELSRSKGITYGGQNSTTMDTASATRLIAFNAEVDRLVAAAVAAGKPETQAFAEARSKALLDYAPGSTATQPKWRWEDSAEKRAEMPGVIADREGNVQQVVTLSGATAGVTATEMRAVLQSLGAQETGEAWEASVAEAMRQIERNPDFDDRRRGEMIGKLLAQANLPAWVSPNDVARALVEKRTTDQKSRAEERAATPGMVSVERLARALGKSPADVRADLAERKIDVPDDDLAYGDVETFEVGTTRNRLLDVDAIVGISRAAADKWIEAQQMKGLTGFLDSVQTTGDAQEQVRWLESFASPEVPKRIEELRAAQARFQAQYDALPDDEKASPYGQSLQQQASMLGVHARYLAQPDRAEVEAAWEAWLQQGGEVYEGEFDAEIGRVSGDRPAVVDAAIQSGLPQRSFLNTPFRTARSLDLIRSVPGQRPRYAAMPTYERHREMRALRDRLLGGQ